MNKMVKRLFSLFSVGVLVFFMGTSYAADDGVVGFGGEDKADRELVGIAFDRFASLRRFFSGDDAQFQAMVAEGLRLAKSDEMKRAGENAFSKYNVMSKGLRSYFPVGRDGDIALYNMIMAGKDLFDADPLLSQQPLPAQDDRGGLGQQAFGSVEIENGVDSDEDDGNDGKDREEISAQELGRGRGGADFGDAERRGPREEVPPRRSRGAEVPLRSRGFVRQFIDAIRQYATDTVGSALRGTGQAVGRGIEGGAFYASGGLAQGFFNPAILRDILREMRNIIAEGGEGAGAIRDLFESLVREGSQGFGQNIREHGGPALREGLGMLGQEFDHAFGEEGELGGAIGNMRRAALDGIRGGIQEVDGELEEAANRWGDRVGRANREGLAMAQEWGEQFANFNNAAMEGAEEWQSFGLQTLLKSVMILCILPCTYFTASYGGKVLFDYIDRCIKRPNLLKDSSQKSLFTRIMSKISLWRKAVQEVKEDMIFSPEQEKQLQAYTRIAKKVNTWRKAGKKNMTFPRLLMVGPPGTGKTMFASKFARESGMDFAELTGGSLSQFKKGTAIAEIDKLFKWAESNPNGTVIFIDEVDSLLTDRDAIGDKDGDNYKTINHILSLTGKASANYMLIMTTNKYEVLDEAVLSRIDEVIQMGLPDVTLRKRLLSHYITKIFYNAFDNDEAFIKQTKAIFTDSMLNELAQGTEGYEHRQIHSLVNMLYGNVLVAPGMKLTEVLIKTTLDKVAARRLLDTKKQQYKQQVMGIAA